MVKYIFINTEADMQRVQRKRVKGWRMPENTISVCRPGRWGNPYRVSESLSAADAVAKFREYLATDAGLELVAQSRQVLGGKNLACFCGLDSPCHADVWLEVANS